MPRIPTFNDLFRIARDEILVRNARVSKDAIEREGMDANALVAAMSAVGDEVMGRVAIQAAGLFLDSAVGEDLDRLVFDRYGLVRKPASAALGSVQFRTATASPTTFSIPSGTLVQSATGLQYLTTEDVIFPITSTGPITAAVRSVLAGADQNALANTITSIISTISSAPSDLTVNNDYATAGADDQETDEVFRERARTFFTTARRGTLAALESAALAVEGVRKAYAVELLDAMGRPARFVQLIVADAFTEAFADLTTTPALYQTQSQVLASTVFDALAETRPAGIFVHVIVANVVMQAVQLSLAFQAGQDANLLALKARSATVNYVNGLAPGASFVAANLRDILSRIGGLVVNDDVVASPSGEVIPKPQQVLRTTLGLVSAVSLQTDQPIITGTNPDSFALAQN